MARTLRASHSAHELHTVPSSRAGLSDLDEDLQARGADPALRPLLHSLRPAARSGNPILLVGESGVGKEFFARHLHRLRWGSPAGFVSVLAVGVTAERLDDLLERNRTEPGSGHLVLSLYVRCVELLGPAIQTRLANWLEASRRTTRRFPFLLAGSQRDIAARAERGEFDPLLAEQFFEFGPLRVPPFRDRREDRLFVAMEILARLSRETGRPLPRLSARSWDRILRGPWHGNVRELVNALRLAVVESEPAPVVSIGTARRTPS